MDTCALALGENWQGVHTIAYYAHLIPVALALFLGSYAFVKTKGSKLSTIFFFFTAFVSLWLVGSLVDWVSQNYFYIYFFWSWLDYINVVFFVLGAYFFGVLARGKVSWIEKGLYVALCVPAFWLTVTGNAVTDFYQPVCEAIENPTITTYKLFAEWAAVAFMLFSLIIAWRKSDKRKRIQMSIVLLAMLLFFAVFSWTEYIATITNIYEINLYGLFVLPIFLIMMVFSITNLEVFKIRFLGTQLLVYTLLIMIGSQFLFLQSTTDAYLNGLTLLTAVFFSLLLLRNTKKELEARMMIEKLAGELEVANEHQASLIHFITHQVKGFLTKSRYIFGELIEGTYGALSPKMHEVIKQGYQFNTDGVSMVQNVLHASNIKKGTVTYEKEPLDFKQLVEVQIEKQRKIAEGKGLTFSTHIEPGDYAMEGDAAQLGNAIQNLIDNAIKYTPKGEVTVSLARTDSGIRFSVKDSGIGISEKDKEHIFTEGGKGENSQATNPDSTGYGLYIVKGIAEAHGGKVWFESPGPGQGTIFFIELPGK
jgi:signal transduction histidine kinase